MTTNRISPSNLQDTLILALATALPSPRATLQGADALANAVATQLGIAVGDWGIVESQASKPTWMRYNSIRSFRFVKASGLGNSPQKNHYGLSAKGWEKAKELGYVPVSSPVKEEALVELVEYAEQATQPETVSAPQNNEEHGVGVGVSLATLLQGNLEDSYHADPYITSLGIESAKCFGFHTKNSPTCQGCPIAKSCRSAWLQDLAEMAAKMTADEVAENIVEEIIEEEPEEEKEQTEEVVEAQQTAKTPNQGTPVILPADSQCIKCGVTLTEGTEALVEWGTTGAFCKCCP